MGRLAIRRVEYFGDAFTFTSPELPDGLVIIEGSNGSGKTTFADLIYFALGGAVKKFAKRGGEQHKEIMGDSNNGVRLTFEINGSLHVVTRRFDASEDVLLASYDSEHAEVLPIARRGDRQTFSDWLLNSLGIKVVTLSLGTFRGKLNFTDVLRLVYHDQDPDPSRVFKKADRDNFVTDSREFRRAVFEILIGRASEAYYETMGELKLAQARLSDREGALTAYKSAVDRASRVGSRERDANAEFLKQAILEREEQVVRLEQLRKGIRQSAPNAPAGESALLELRHRLADAEVGMAEAEQNVNAMRGERTRLGFLMEQIIDEVERMRKIVHAHETLSLFSPNTCPCCLRQVDRAVNHCICGEPIEESAYQRFFYSSAEYLKILKSKQKNVETVRAAVGACDSELTELTQTAEKHKADATQARKEMGRWAGYSGTYSTELQRLDDELIITRIMIDRLSEQLALELERDKLDGEVIQARALVDRLTKQATKLEMDAQEDRACKLAQFDKIYSSLMRTTLKGVRFAALDANYEPTLNDSEYREASSNVTRRLMYFVTLLQMSLSDNEIPFPRFLLVDTPETAGIDQENLIRAVGKIPEVLNSVATPAQVILTSGEGRYPAELRDLRKIILTIEAPLLQPTRQTLKGD